MNSKSNTQLSFDPDAWELSVVAHRPRDRLLISSRQRIRRQSVWAANTQLLLAPRAGRPAKRKTVS